jgi:hypothetical protein
VTTLITYFSRYWNIHNENIVQRNICLSLLTLCFALCSPTFNLAMDQIYSFIQTLFTEVFTSIFICTIQKFPLVRYFKPSTTHTHAHTRIKQDLQTGAKWVQYVPYSAVRYSLCVHNNCHNTYRTWCYSSVWVLASSSPASKRQ